MCGRPARPDWNPSADDQAVDRINRYGQKVTPTTPTTHTTPRRTRHEERDARCALYTPMYARLCVVWRPVQAPVVIAYRLMATGGIEDKMFRSGQPEGRVVLHPYHSKSRIAFVCMTYPLAYTRQPNAGVRCTRPASTRPHSRDPNRCGRCGAAVHPHPHKSIHPSMSVCRVT